MWVDPMRDMKAAEVAVANGWKTNTKVAADIGEDFDDNQDELARENATIAKNKTGTPNENAK
jgi:capsid protein